MTDTVKGRIKSHHKIDYRDQLNADEKAWMDLFTRSEIGFSDATQVLAGDKAPELIKKISAERYNQKTDLMNRGTWIGEKQEPDYSALYQDELTPQFTHFKCLRCVKKIEICTCPTKTRRASYSIADYSQPTYSEDNINDVIDEMKHAQAYDLQPYGDCPTDMESGYKVKICMPEHLFEGEYGEVILPRETDGDYLVRITTHKGISGSGRGRDRSPLASRPDPLMYAKPLELQHPPLDLKNNSKVPKE